MLDLGEFRFIDSLLKNSAPLAENSPEFRNWLGAGDDAAIFDGWLATKDLSVENSHFRLDWSSPEQAVEKHIVSNVSDISAMGGVPKIALFGICINKKWDEDVRSRIVKAASEGFAKRGITLIGGDTVSGDVGMFSTTLLGVQAGAKPLLRSSAKPGDSVYVAGTLGKSAAGLWILEHHPEITDKFARLVKYHLNPKIEEAMGAHLVKMGVDGASMDISDGLSSELNHLALSSSVRIDVFEEKIPVDPDVLRLCDFYHLDPMQFALNGGEEYQLLFTTKIKKDIFSKEFAPGSVYEIGTVQEGTGVFMQGRGREKIVKAQAWSHL